MDYKSLEQEIEDKKDKLMAQNWRGDLSRKGLDNISWGDLKEIESKVLNKHNVK